MKAKVYVTLKPSVLDPQGKAIHHSVELLGYNGISDIRQGKYFEIALDATDMPRMLTSTNVLASERRLPRDVLANPHHRRLTQWRSES